MPDISRRAFLQLLAGGSAAGAAALTEKAADKLIPYVLPPESIVPGTWTVYATTCRECPAGCGMHVRHRDGRICKCEGNPDHPINRGGLCPRGQSAVQGLYDPDRLRQPLHRPAKGAKPTPVDWATAISHIGKRLADARGKALLLSDLQTGSLAQVTRSFCKAFSPDTGPLLFEPLNCESLGWTNREAFGDVAIPDYRIDRCDFVISFGADFLETWVSPVRFAHQFAQMRTCRDGRVGRFVYVGPRLSMTAANADDFIQLRPDAMAGVAVAMLAAIVEMGLARQDVETVKAFANSPAARAWAAAAAEVPHARIRQLARAFAHAEGSAALAGPAGMLGPAADWAALASALLNCATGRVGHTVDFSRSHSLAGTALRATVLAALAAGAPGAILIVHGANPAYALPDSAGSIREAGMVVYLGTMMDETAELADWVLPVDSPLESWGDHEPMAGIHCLMQPTMSRLWDTRPAGDVLLDLAAAAGKPLMRETPDEARGGPGRGDSRTAPGRFERWLRARWEDLRQRIAPTRDAGEFWREALRAGGAWEEPAPATVKLAASVANLQRPPPSALPPPAGKTAELWAWPTISLYDGRTANRGWLQELPDPTTSIVWGSWVDVHPNKARDLGLEAGDIVELGAASGKVEVPVRITEDVAESVVAIPLGQGHSALGRNAAGRGANAAALLGRVSDGDLGTVSIRKAGRRYDPAAAAATQDQHGRNIMQWVTIGRLRRMKPGEGDRLRLPLPEGYDPARDVYAPHPYKEHRWAMVVDLARCIGCGACAVACYAENNVAVVGEDQVRRRHDLPWLQVVPYRHQEQPGRLGFLPLMCQHCDAAPCEPVCPVFASVHNDEGLNAQVYNRCIGTRYCMNNCPYKVRRFNWLDHERPKPLDWQLNPDVTVRSRGVMEKCTFCIQRIREAEIRARREGRKVRDGEVQPACAQSCPTRAFTFGDLLDPASRASELTRRDPRRYHVLSALNTKPAVTYLRRILAEADT
jgi:molybdopterin-containing oxidoreductase family iron-sulfur binding subunit